MLFSRLAFRSCRTAGKNISGQTTLWGRHAVTRVEPWWVGSPSGVARQWDETTQVGPGGLTWRVKSSRVGGFTCTTRGALPPGSPPGWSTLLKWIPVGTPVSMTGWAARAPGSSAKVLRHRGRLVQLRFPSRLVCWVSSSLGATLGSAGGVHPPRVTSAGGSWRAGLRPRVRGVAINPVDHPHGGGQGKTSGGRPGTTPWGRLTRGVPTRKIRPRR